MTDAMGLSYYGIPGIDISANTGFQYREPPQQNAFMRPDEYDQLIEDPTGFLLNVWLPRVSTHLRPAGEPVTEAHNLSLLKGGMAMMEYFGAFAEQNARLRARIGHGLGDLRHPQGPHGHHRRQAPRLPGAGRGPFRTPRQGGGRLRGADAAPVATSPARRPIRSGFVPIGYWMHRGGVPFVSPEIFQNIYWATIKPIIEELWADGHQTLFYAEGKWDYHLESFAELPEQSIVYHVDQGDIFKAHRVLGDKFCFSGGVPNVMLAYSSPDEVRRHCKKIIEGVARDGGYIMDASAIVQNEGRVENLRAMTDSTREYGVYSSGHSRPAAELVAAARPPAIKSPLVPAPGRKAAGRRAFPGKRNGRSCRRSPAMKTWSGRYGSTSTAWRTCIFGRCYYRFETIVPLSPSGRGLG